MRKTVLIILATFASLLVANSAWSLTITYDGIVTEVGEKDLLIDSTKLENSGESSEEEWVETVLGFDVVFVDKQDLETPEESWFQTNEDADVFAFQLLEDPSYFLVKTGGGGIKNADTTHTHFLFSNFEELSWAVINLEVDLGAWEIQRISHVAEFDGAPVPEPGTLLLLGSGLAGLASFQRKRKRK